MNHKNIIIQSLVRLGAYMAQFTGLAPIKSEKVLHNDIFFEGFKHQLKLANEHNGWFTKANLCYALKQWAELLQNRPLELWLAPYHIPTKNPKTIAIIMAGNIPLVGFHDFISALVSGHSIIVKQSSNDRHLLPYLAAYLTHLEPHLKLSLIHI